MAEYWAAQRVEQLVALMVDCLVDKMDVVWVAQMDGSTAVHSAARSAVRSVALMDES